MNMILMFYSFKTVFGNLFVDGNRIFPVKAGKAEFFPGNVGCLYQVVNIEVAQAIQAYKVTDFLNGS
jgi:hypothetical protein